MIRAVVLDVGECLVDETRMWAGWADRLGVPRFTFAAMFGAVLARGLDHREVFRVFVPGFDLAHARAAGGTPEVFEEGDLYPDARPALAALRAAGLRVGIAGNQTAGTIASLRALDLPADFVAGSADWGVEKPAPAFFARVVQEARCGPGEVLHVGDRLDNDVRPAAAAGLRTALIRRGPWAWIHWDDPDAARLPTVRIDSLLELPDRIADLITAATP